MPSPNPDRADVLVLGDGIIGLATALAVARAGGTCRIIGKAIDGQATSASGGLLAPSLGICDEPVRALMRASRDLYSSWLHWLAERTGIEVTLNRLGILEVDVAPATSKSVDVPNGDPDALPLGSNEVQSLEPALAPTEGAILHQEDGYVDTVILLDALREAVRCEWSIDVVDGRAASVEPGRQSCSVKTEDGRVLSGDNVVLAAGAWSALVAGLPRPILVEPVRGQMLAFEGCLLTHAVASPHAYLVPRAGTTLVGSTLERVGFDNRTTTGALEHLRKAAISVVPQLEETKIAGAWAGLRPMTPDALPIVGRDPDFGTLVYACGHGKNGILLAPLTGDCVAAIIASSATPFDIAPFSVQRFD
jgi:glycine oxidase